MNKAEYFALVKEWERKYGVPSRAFRYDPTQVKTCCRKCGQMRAHMSRHHKANDFFFALHFPDLYAARYIQFLDEDCDKLCDGCHKRCHEYFKALTKHLYDEFAALKGTEVQPTIEEWQAWCERWKTAFRSAYTNWMARNKKHRRRLVPKREV